MAYIKEFESIKSFYDYLYSNEIKEIYKDKLSSEFGSFKFTTTKNMKKADDLLLYGDSVNYTEIAAHMGKDITAQTTTISRPVAAVCGFFPHVPNFIAGVPTAMVRPEKIRQKNPVLTIYYNMEYCGSVSADEIVKNGIKLIQIIDYLEQQKHIRCNLFVGNFSEFPEKKCGYFVCVKKSNAAFDMQKLAYPLANPSFWRRHGFRWIEVDGNVPYHPGYGRSVKMTQTDINKPNTVIINGQTFTQDIDILF